jgi:hypothetical protein
MRRATNVRGQSWRIDPETIDVELITSNVEQALLGNWLKRARSPGAPVDAPANAWWVYDTSSFMTLPDANRLWHARGAPGIALYSDADRRVHRVDLVAGIDEPTQVVLDEKERPSLSDDGRWLVYRRASGLELLELATGRVTSAPGAQFLKYVDRPLHFAGAKPSMRWALWTRRAEPLLVDVSRENSIGRRWRLVGLDGEREFSVAGGCSMPVDLDGTHWLVCNLNDRGLLMLDADGNAVRTLRVPSEEVAR